MEQLIGFNNLHSNIGHTLLTFGFSTVLFAHATYNLAELILKFSPKVLVWP